MKNLHFMFLLTCLIGLSSCISTRKEFKAENVKGNEGILVGTVNVTYNKKNWNPECTVCFNTTGSKCQKMMADGIVVLSLPRGEAELSKITCRDVSAQNYHIRGATLQVKSGVNYFGQINIDWENKGGYKISDAFGAIGAMIADGKNDGAIKITTTDGDPKQVMSEFEAITKQKTPHFQKVALKVVNP